MAINMNLTVGRGGVKLGDWVERDRTGPGEADACARGGKNASTRTGSGINYALRNESAKRSQRKNKSHSSIRAGTLGSRVVSAPGLAWI